MPGYDSVKKALSVAIEVGGVVIAIDAKQETAAVRYERFGALGLLDDPLRQIYRSRLLRMRWL